MAKRNEGEGNKTAAREYNQGATEHAQSGKSDKAAKAAAEALDSPEGSSLRDAENKGRKQSKGEDPQLTKPIKNQNPDDQAN